MPISQVIADPVKALIAGLDVVVIRFVDKQAVPFTWEQIAQFLCHSASFREQWQQVWASVGFDFQWKPVPIHATYVTTHPFFAVLVPATFAPANPSAYMDQLAQLAATDLVADFTNLSGDAHLVIPQTLGDYGHIAAFCRSAPSELYHALWLRVGELATTAMQQGQSVWCNTHGHGVPWMHIRFDQYLKYTTFPPSGEIDDRSQTQWYETIYQIAYPNASPI